MASSRVREAGVERAGEAVVMAGAVEAVGEVVEVEVEDSATGVRMVCIKLYTSTATSNEVAVWGDNATCIRAWASSDSPIVDIMS